jgi:hypothetical protein
LFDGFNRKEFAESVKRMDPEVIAVKIKDVVTYFVYLQFGLWALALAGWLAR